MRILITNDDGYNAEGIKLLIEKAQKYGEVFVVAPMNEQSAMSHAITVRRKIRYIEYDDHHYSIDSTTADCVRFASYGLKLDYDMVFSGVNKGFNVGEDIWYSGTLSAVFESDSVGKKAIGFSCDKEGFDGFIKCFDEVMEYINQNKLLDYCNLYNINFPINPKGILITHQGKCNFDNYFNFEGDYVYQDGYPSHDNNKLKLEIDVPCVMNDYISITPMTSDRTDFNAYNCIKKKCLDKK